LPAHVTRAGRASDRNIEVLFYNRLASIRGESAVRDFRRRWLIENLRSAAAWSAGTIVLIKSFALNNSGRRRTTVEVFVDVYIATASWKTIVFSEAEVVVFLATATPASLGLVTTTPSTSHALESIAIPSLTVSQSVVNTAKISRRSSIHGRDDCGLACTIGDG
jgi:hypothetical protein